MTEHPSSDPRLRASLWLTLGLALSLALLLLLAVQTGPAQASGPCDRYVLGFDTSDSSDCSDMAHPCRTVQFAINQAADGDHICIADHMLAPGPTIYDEMLVITRTLTLDGAWEGMCVDPSDLTCSFTAVTCDPNAVVLDAEGSGRVIDIQGAIAPTIDCLTITGGDAVTLAGDPGGNDAGGGIYSLDAAPIVVNSVISGNYGCDFCTTAYGRGGGIYLRNAPATAVISGNLIAHNVADNSTWGQGGGLYLRDSSAQVVSNVIEFNRAGHSAGDGGGLAVYGGAPVIAHNEILTNVAGQAVLGNGGGIFAWFTASVTIEDNLVQGNFALSGASGSGLTSQGGGIYYRGTLGATAIVRRNRVLYNTAGQDSAGRGGGLCLQDFGPGDIIADNDVLENFASVDGEGKGGGFAIFTSTTRLEGGLIEGNYATPGDEGRGGGLYVKDSSLIVAGAVFSNNIAGGIDGIGRGGGIYATGSQATLVENQFILNHAALYSPPWAGSGGAVELWFSHNSLLRDNVFDDNRAPIYGGAIYCQGSEDITLTHNLMINNVALEGGGAQLRYCDDALLEANTIVSNTASHGGGLHLFNGTTTLNNNIISGNTLSAAGNGSGIVVQGNVARLRHNTIAANTNGSGLYITSYGGGKGDVDLHNTILVSHSVGISVAAGTTATLEATLWGNTLDWGGAGTITTGTLNLWGDPAFVDPANHDYHLTWPSDAVGAAQASIIDSDVDLHTRPYLLPDLGADEVIGSPVTPGAGGTLTFTDTQGSPTTIEVPPGAVDEPLTLVYTPVPTASEPALFAFAGHAFHLEAYLGDEIQPGYLFDEPVLVTIHYSDSDVAGLVESHLLLLWWDGSAWVDAACGPYDRHPAANWLSAPICHLSDFSLQAQTSFSTYLPIIIRTKQ